MSRMLMISHRDHGKVSEYIQETKKPAEEPTSLGYTLIPFADSVKYHGVLLDRRLNNELNILERIDKPTLTLYSC